MGKKEFIVVVLNPEHETYVVHIELVNSNTLPSSSLLNVYFSRRLWIFGLIAKEAFTKISAKYSDFADVFSPDLVSKLPEHSGINEHAIELVDGSQQPSYGPIYSLQPVELETLKAYIKTNLANRFIKPSKFPARAPILFDRKLDGFFLVMH